MNTQTKILIVEHDTQDIELLKYALTKGGISYISEVVENELDYCASLERYQPDIILSDYSFPSFDGLRAFTLRESLCPNVPFIFVSGAIGEETSVELIKKGVTDFVLKDKLFSLCLKVKRALCESLEKRQKIGAEQDLRKSERRLSKAQELAHMGSWEFDFATNDILWSDETFRIYGIECDHCRQSFMTALSFVHPKDLVLVLKKIKRALNTLSDFSIHFRIVRTGGTVRHIFLDSKLEIDAMGQPSGFYGIVHDVTDTVLLENKIVQERLTRQRKISEAVLTAQENERSFIGKELHENINQILAVVNLYLQLARSYPDETIMYLDKSSKMVGTVIEEIRKISKVLTMPALKFIGLFASIRTLVYDVNLTNSTKVDFETGSVSEESLNEKLQLTLYRIVQEQMTNILKHAHATSATIRLSISEDQLVLLISDNGDGYDPAKEIDGVGIINIRSRAEAYHGQVSISSRPGEGYVLKVQMLLNPENAPGTEAAVSYVP
ncbi:MAG TPA: response regulator [Puia sp.]|nr:response regulator [Puia sp.]